MQLVAQIFALWYFVFEGPLHLLALTLASLIATIFGAVWHLRYRGSSNRKRGGKMDVCLTLAMILLLIGAPTALMTMVSRYLLHGMSSDIELVFAMFMTNAGGFVYAALAFVAKRSESKSQRVHFKTQ